MQQQQQQHQPTSSWDFPEGVVLWLSVPHILLIFTYIILQALCSPLLCPFSNLSFKVSLRTKKRREYTYTYIHLCVLARAHKKKNIPPSLSLSL
jgi:hypothetical protein